MGELGARSAQYRDTTAETRPAIAGRSLLRTSPFLVLLAIAAADALNYADHDLGMHIILGRFALATHHLMTRDVFSYTARGLPYHNHEWLAQVALAFAWQVAGSLGLRLLKMACAGGAIIALALAIAATDADMRMQRMALLLTAVALAPFFHLRPEFFTLMLLSVEIALLSFETYRGETTLWPLIPIFALWANLHGGFVAGLGALGLFAMTVFVRDAVVGTRMRRGWQLLGLTAACAIATLANPFGVGVWKTVLLSAGNSVLNRNLAEWAPLWLRIATDLRTSPVNLLIFVLPLAIVVWAGFVVLKTPTWKDFPLVAIAIVFTAAAFDSTRYFALAMIVLAVPLARHASLVRHLSRAKGRITENPDKAPNAILLATFALALVLIGGEVSAAPLRVAPPSPVGAVAFMTKHDLHGNILNGYSWGTYLILHAYPQSHVFIDGRFQLVYPNKLVRRYLAFDRGEPKGKAVLHDYPNDLVLVSPKSGAFRLVSADPRWQLIYRDGVAALFVKSSSKAAREFPHPVIGKSPPSLFP